MLHEAPGLTSDWARDAKVNDRIGIVIFALPAGHNPATTHEADIYLLFADEAAFPAAQTNLESFAPGAKVIAFFEVADKDEASKSAGDFVNKPIAVASAWVISIKSPLGAQVVTLRFSTLGNRFTGTMESKLGSGVISDGIVDGHTLTWTSTIEHPRRAKLEFSATIDGDSISGVAKMGTFVQTAFKGKRS